MLASNGGYSLFSTTINTLTTMIETTNHTIAQIIGPTDPNSAIDCRIVAVGTIDGSATINGNSQQLGNSLDTALLLGLRHWADCILVGAGTVRADNYDEPVVPPQKQQQRLKLKQHPIPPLAIVSRSLEFPATTRLFRPTTQPQIFITDLAQAPPAHVEKLQRYGHEILDVPALQAPEIITALKARGFRRISCEGGPYLNAKLLAANLVNTIHLTVDPRLCLTTKTPLFGIGNSTEILDCILEHVHLSDDSVVFLRYGIKR